MPSKTDVKAMNVEPLRDLLNQHFEGVTNSLNKAELQEIVEDNWDYLDPILNPPEPEVNPRQARLSKDLYTGHPPKRLLADLEEE